ncbi:uncharacterized protein LOC129687462 isoform X2 [Psammomys obesus]|uniref:uncharacterized protein LOC129687462 isoform X2 n=1 Tax=Psammomys obesus TaxID=48139 RepID=UPI0024534138|nr:uncharacterized protein LOC129687462 isoform X2 [Psammomys obesus]
MSGSCGKVLLFFIFLGRNSLCGSPLSSLSLPMFRGCDYVRCVTTRSFPSCLRSILSAQVHTDEDFHLEPGSTGSASCLWIKMCELSAAALCLPAAMLPNVVIDSSLWNCTWAQNSLLGFLAPGLNITVFWTEGRSPSSAVCRQTENQDQVHRQEKRMCCLESTENPHPGPHSTPQALSLQNLPLCNCPLPRDVLAGRKISLQIAGRFVEFFFLLCHLVLQTKIQITSWRRKEVT